MLSTCSLGTSPRASRANLVMAVSPFLISSFEYDASGTSAGKTQLRLVEKA